MVEGHSPGANHGDVALASLPVAHLRLLLLQYVNDPVRKHRVHVQVVDVGFGILFLVRRCGPTLKKHKTIRLKVPLELMQAPQLFTVRCFVRC